MDNSRSFLRQAESRDGGRSWTVAHKIPLLGYPPHLIRLQDGRLVSVYGRRLPPYGEYACISRDNGRTWDVDREVKLAAADNGDLGYPASAELPDGYLNVFVEWSDFVCLARMDAEGNRVLITRETPRALAKNRYGMPESIPFDWTSFTNAVAEGLAHQFPQAQEQSR